MDRHPVRRLRKTKPQPTARLGGIVSVKTITKITDRATGPRALPQGACASPAISNLIARKLDAQLEKDADLAGWIYTRYADDITFLASGEATQKTAKVLARIRHVAEHQGFAVNEKKTRVQRRNMAQAVTGIVVNDRPGVSRKLARRIRAILHRAKTEGLANQNRESRPNFNAWLNGMIAYIAMVNPKQGAAFRSQLGRTSISNRLRRRELLLKNRMCLTDAAR